MRGSPSTFLGWLILLISFVMEGYGKESDEERSRRTVATLGDFLGLPVPRPAAMFTGDRWDDGDNKVDKVSFTSFSNDDVPTSNSNETLASPSGNSEEPPIAAIKTNTSFTEQAMTSLATTTTAASSVAANNSSLETLTTIENSARNAKIESAMQGLALGAFFESTQAPLVAFSDDNFDENYQKVNNTYFAQGRPAPDDMVAYERPYQLTLTRASLRGTSTASETSTTSSSTPHITPSSTTTLSVTSQYTTTTAATSTSTVTTGYLMSEQPVRVTSESTTAMTTTVSTTTALSSVQVSPSSNVPSTTTTTSKLQQRVTFISATTGKSTTGKESSNHGKVSAAQMGSRNGNVSIRHWDPLHTLPKSSIQLPPFDPIMPDEEDAPAIDSPLIPIEWAKNRKGKMGRLTPNPWELHRSDVENSILLNTKGMPNVDDRNESFLKSSARTIGRDFDVRPLSSTARAQLNLPTEVTGDGIYFEEVISSTPETLLYNALAQNSLEPYSIMTSYRLPPKNILETTNYGMDGGENRGVDVARGKEKDTLENVLRQLLRQHSSSSNASPSHSETTRRLRSEFLHGNDRSSALLGERQLGIRDSRPSGSVDEGQLENPNDRLSALLESTADIERLPEHLGDRLRALLGERQLSIVDDDLSPYEPNSYEENYYQGDILPSLLKHATAENSLAPLSSSVAELQDFRPVKSFGYSDLLANHRRPHGSNRERRPFNDPSFVSGGIKNKSESKSKAFAVSKSHLMKGLQTRLTKAETDLANLLKSEVMNSRDAQPIQVIAQGKGKDSSFKKYLLDGQTIEERTTVIGGKPVTVRAWNKHLHGADLLTSPGAIVDAPMRPTQRNIISIESGDEVSALKVLENMRRMRVLGAKTRDSSKAIYGDTNNTALSTGFNALKRFWTGKPHNPVIEWRRKNEKNRQEKQSTTVVKKNKPRRITITSHGILPPGHPRLPNAATSDFKIENCIEVARNAILANASPFERRTETTAAECALFCMREPECSSAGFSNVTSICDIYDTRKGFDDAKLVGVPGHFYFEPINRKSSFCRTEVPRRGAHKFGDSRSISNDQYSGTLRISSMVNGLVPDTTDDDFLQAHARSFADASSECPEGRGLVFEKSVGWRLKAYNGNEIIFPTSEAVCVFACVNNLGNGTRPFKCASVNYEMSSRLCTLSSLAAGRDANSNLIEDSSVIYYGKTCVAESVATRCSPNSIERQPQHILLGFSAAVLTASSLSDCLFRCFHSLSGGENFQCLSAMYFHEEASDNCMLNSETRQRRPYAFSKELASSVDYVAFDECLPRKKRFSKEIGVRRSTPSKRDRQLTLSKSLSRSSKRVQKHTPSIRNVVFSSITPNPSHERRRKIL